MIKEGGGEGNPEILKLKISPGKGGVYNQTSTHTHRVPLLLSLPISFRVVHPSKHVYMDSFFKSRKPTSLQTLVCRFIFLTKESAL